MALIKEERLKTVQFFYDEHGQLHATKVQLRTVIKDDVTGEIESDASGRSLNLTQALASGFVLTDIMDQALIDKTVEAEASIATIADRDAEIRELKK